MKIPLLNSLKKEIKKLIIQAVIVFVIIAILIFIAIYKSDILDIEYLIVSSAIFFVYLICSIIKLYITCKEYTRIQKEHSKLVEPKYSYERLGVDILMLQISTNIVVKHSDEIDKIASKIAVLRRKLVDNFGYIIPSVRILDSAKIPDNSFEILVRGKTVYKSEFDKEMSIEEIFTLFAENIEKIVFEYANKIITRKDILTLIELVSESYDKTLPKSLLEKITAEDIREIYVRLISKKINVKDVLLIFERLNYFAQKTQDVEELSEKIEKELI